MTAAGLHPLMKEALAVHEALRRLGFSPEEIRVALVDRCLKLILDAQGKRFVVDVGVFEGPEPEGGLTRWAQESWREAARLWNHDMTDAEHRAIWSGSEVYEKKVLFMALLRARGFEFHLGRDGEAASRPN